MTELVDDVGALRQAFGDDMQHAPSISAVLKAYEEQAVVSRKTALGSFAASVFLSARSRAAQRQIKMDSDAILSVRALRERWDSETYNQYSASVHAHLDAYFKTVRRATNLHFYERLFSLWHLLHLPLFLFLILASVAHIIAVHLY